MSIIVYGPVTTDLMEHAERIREYFCCEEVVDAQGFDPFPVSKKQVEEFKAGWVLYMTNIDPTINDYATRHDYKRRVYPYHLALAAANGAVNNAN